MIVTDDCQVSRQRRDGQKSQRSTPAVRSAPYQSRTAPVRPAGSGSACSKRGTRRCRCRNRALDDVDRRTPDRTQPSSASSTQRAVAGAIAEPESRSEYACGADACEPVRAVSSDVHRRPSRGYSACSRTFFNLFHRRAFSPSLFFLLKSHRSLKNFPAGSLRSASAVR